MAERGRSRTLEITPRAATDAALQRWVDEHNTADVNVIALGKEFAGNAEDIGFAECFYRSCLQVFQQLWKAASEEQSPFGGFHSDDVRGSFARFHLWGEHLGHGKLDKILADSEDVRDAVLEFLYNVGAILTTYADPLFHDFHHRGTLLKQSICELDLNLEKCETLLTDDNDDPDTRVLPQDGELGLEDLLDITQSLMELSPTIERTSRAEKRELDCAQDSVPVHVMEATQPFVLQVHDKFRQADQRLVRRLGEANWLRSIRLREKAKTIPKDVGLTVTDVPEPSISASAPVSKFRDSALGSSVPAKSAYEASAVSHTSMLSSDANIEKGRLRVPPTPVEVGEGRPFQCSICHNTLRNIRNQVDWKLHVFTDLEPYVCTFDNCPEAQTIFSTRTIWEDHEFSCHRDTRSWHCSDCGHDSYNSDDFISHLMDAHNISLTGQRLLAVLSAAERWQEQDLSEQSCPLCLTGNWPTRKKFVTHLACHMEDIALTVLPREVDTDSDDDSAASLFSGSRALEGIADNTGELKSPGRGPIIPETGLGAVEKELIDIHPAEEESFHTVDDEDEDRTEGMTHEEILRQVSERMQWHQRGLRAEFPNGNASPLALPLAVDNFQAPYEGPASVRAPTDRPLSRNVMDQPVLRESHNALSSALSVSEVLRESSSPGKGPHYFYDDRFRVQTMLDGATVGPIRVMTKAGKPRKRLAQSCISCKERRIRCVQASPKCEQCYKSNRECRSANFPREPSPETRSAAAVFEPAKSGLRGPDPLPPDLGTKSTMAMSEPAKAGFRSPDPSHPNIGPAMNALNAPSSFAGRRQAGSNLPTFELPPPPTLDPESGGSKGSGLFHTHTGPALDARKAPSTLRAGRQAASNLPDSVFLPPTDPSHFNGVSEVGRFPSLSSITAIQPNPGSVRVDNLLTPPSEFVRDNVTPSSGIPPITPRSRPAPFSYNLSSQSSFDYPPTSLQALHQKSFEPPQFSNNSGYGTRSSHVQHSRASVQQEEHSSGAKLSSQSLRAPYPSYSLPETPGAVMSMVGNVAQVMMPDYNSRHSTNVQDTYSGGYAQTPQQLEERPFKCDQCPQSFNRHHDLKRHRRIHLAVKAYPCGHCDKSFSRIDALKRHVLVKGCRPRMP